MAIVHAEDTKEGNGLTTTSSATPLQGPGQAQATADGTTCCFKITLYIVFPGLNH